MAFKKAVLAALSHTQKFITGKAGNKARRIRKNIAIGFAATAAAVMLIAANPIAPAATAGTIRSGAGSDACTVDVGNTANATVAKSGNYCVVTVTSTTTVTFPSYTNSIGLIVVGGGGGGGTDGGAGGSGGEVRYSSAQAVTPGAAATVTIGSGGVGGAWTVNSASNGSATTVSGAGLSYTANGGIAGGGWNSCSISYGSAGGSGGTGGTSATGGTGGNGTLNGCPNAGGYSYGGAGGNGPYISTVSGVSANYYSGGGGGGTCTGQGWNSNVTGAAGGANGGGQGTSFISGSGATAGANGSANTGGGGGAGSACTWGGTDKVNQRTPGGAGGSGVAIFSFLANKLAINQAPDGCLSNVAEPCLQSAKVQVQDSNGGNLSTSGLTVTLVSASAGTLAGTLTANTDATGIATFSNFWLTGLSVGNTTTLTFEIPGWRNIQTTVTMKAYAETLNVVSGSVDSNGAFFGSTGKWLATASTSNVSVTSLANELANRDVTLRASSPTSTLGSIAWNANAVMSATLSSARTLNLITTQNFYLTAGGRMSATGAALNVLFNSNYDNSNGGMVGLQGTSSGYAVDTNGGWVYIGGGSATTTWNSVTVPSGYAEGFGASTSSWWGIEFNVNTDIANGLLIRTGGGAFKASGQATASTGVSLLYGIAWEGGKIDTGAGAFTMVGTTSGSPSVATNDNFGIGIGANHGTANDSPVFVTTNVNAFFNGNFGTAGTSNAQGVNIAYADCDTGTANVYLYGSKTVNFGPGNTFRSPVLTTPTGAVTISAATTFPAATSLTAGTSFTTSAAVTTTGAPLNITASSGDVTLGGTITQNSSNSAVTIKASGNIIANTGASITTAGGAVNLYSDTDATSGGNIQLGTTATNSPNITTNGGAVTLSGGDANGTGYARGTSTATIAGNAGVLFYSDIATSGGAVTIRGQAGTATIDSAAVYMQTGASIDTRGSSSSGNVNITGLVGADQSQTTAAVRSVRLGAGGSTNQVSITVGHTATITVSSDSSAGAASTQDGILLEGANLASVNGDITLTSKMALGDAAPIYITTATSTIGTSGTGVVYIKEDSANASTTATYLNNLNLNTAGDAYIQVNRLSTAAGTTFTAAGTLRVEPASSSFPVTMNFPGSASVGSTTGGLVLGKSLTSGAITLGSSNVSMAGPITVIGTQAGIDANATVTGSGNAITLKSADSSWIGASRAIQTNGGNIVFWANADKTVGNVASGGRITVGASTTIKSQGGKIWLAGGLDDAGTDSGLISGANNSWTQVSNDGLPDGYAMGQTCTGCATGIWLNPGVLLSSAGGDMLLAGMESTTTSDGVNAQIVIGGASLDSGTGRIGIWGKSSGTAVYSDGINLHRDANTADTTIYSANRTAQAITIYGDNSGAGNVGSDGVTAWNYSPLSTRWGYNSVHVIASGLKNSADLVNFPGGGINITGKAYSGSGASGAHGVIWQFADVIAKDGPITMTGYDYDPAGSYNSAGIYIGAESGNMYERFGAWTAWNGNNTNTWTDQAGNVIDMSTSTSNITLNATKFVFYEYGSGVVPWGYTFKTTGDITMQSTGTTFTSNQTTTHWQFYRITIAGNPRNVTIGKSTDTSTYRWWSSISATGSVKIYAGFLYLYTQTRPISTTLAASGTSTRNIGILLAATDRVYFSDTSTNFTTQGSDFVVWADLDNNGTGSIYSESGLTVTTNGMSRCRSACRP